MNAELEIGAAAIDVTPRRPLFLYGYPHAPRISTGVYDPLFSSAMYFAAGNTAVLFIANDVVLIPREMVRRVRERLSAVTMIPPCQILISATHTHSGPATCLYLADEVDTAIPPLDAEYLQELEAGMIAAGLAAYAARESAEVGVSVVSVEGLGTHRHDSAGPCESRVPVLVARSVKLKRPIGIMLVCAMHPTVLHEDSTLVSGDFPGLARRYLQQKVVDKSCPVLHHTGPCGNLSPRHVLNGNTFGEAERLGCLLAGAVAGAIATMVFERPLNIRAGFTEIDLPRRQFPEVAEALLRVDSARERLAALMQRQNFSAAYFVGSALRTVSSQSNKAVRSADPTRIAHDHLDALAQRQAQRAEIRTAECDVFGAEATLTLARARDAGRLKTAVDACLPAEIQIIGIGKWRWIAWPGELFVEFGLDITRHHPDTFVISLANGDLQGYLTTQQAVTENWYEAGSAVFESPESGRLIVAATNRLLEELRGGR